MTGPIVIKVGGTTLEDPETSPRLWDAVAALAKSRPEGVIVVHGGGKAVDRLLSRLGIAVERRNGLRVTPPEQMDLIAGVLAGSVNKQVVANLLRRQVRAVGICLGDGNAVLTTKKRASDPSFDLGAVGEPLPAGTNDAKSDLLTLLVLGGFTPVVSSIGIGLDGALLNVNADEGAVGVACQARASTLVLMTDVPGIMNGDKGIIQEIDSGGIEDLITRGVISGGMMPKARSAAAASRMIGAPVIILSGNDPAALAGWSAGRPVGTRVLGS